MKTRTLSSGEQFQHLLRKLSPLHWSSAVRQQEEEPTFTPFTQAPTLLNRDEVASALESEYPPLLRDAGVEGTVNVWFHIGEDGRILATQVQESSGHEALDEAALRVAKQVRFSPALDQAEPVPVWVALPISFKVR